MRLAPLHEPTCCSPCVSAGQGFFPVRAVFSCRALYFWGRPSPCPHTAAHPAATSSYTAACTSARFRRSTSARRPRRSPPFPSTWWDAVCSSACVVGDPGQLLIVPQPANERPRRAVGVQRAGRPTGSFTADYDIRCTSTGWESGSTFVFHTRGARYVGELAAADKVTSFSPTCGFSVLAASNLNANSPNTAT